MTGMVDGSRNDTSTAGAGSLSLEFSILSRLVGDPVYERVARRAVNSLWNKRNNITGLLGSVIDVNSGEWLGQLSGLGAGLDSFFEYLLKVIFYIYIYHHFYFFFFCYRIIFYSVMNPIYVCLMMHI